jgi:hypothetical protein
LADLGENLAYMVLKVRNGFFAGNENKGVTGYPFVLTNWHHECYLYSLVRICGGVILKLFRALSLVALLAFAVTTALADGGGDGQPKLSGKGPGSPNCSSFQASTNAAGQILDEDCTVTGTAATTIFFAAPDAGTNGGLTCSANQLVAIGWTQNANVQTTINGVVTDECSFTAPAANKVSLKDIANAAWETLTQSTGDCNCDWDDFITGIPVGCDIAVTTAGDAPNQLFAPNTQFDVSPTQANLIPFPEPGTLWLLVIGFAGLAIVQRKFARKSVA